MWLPYARYRSFWRGVNAPQQYRVRHVLGTQRIRNTLAYIVCMLMSCLMWGSLNPGGTTNEVNATKVNTLRYKSVSWNNNILTVAWPVCRLPITDYLLEHRVTLHSDNLLPSHHSSPSTIASSSGVLRLPGSKHASHFSCFLPIKIVIFMRWRHSQKKQERERRARVRRKYTKYTKK